MRRITAACLLSAGVMVPLTSGAAQEPPVDTVYLGGKVFTADSARLWVEAFAVQGDRIFAVGSTEQIGKLATAKTRRVDLKGQTVIPGLNDAHHHFWASEDVVEIPDPPSPGWNALAQAVKSAARNAPPGTTLEGELAVAWFDPKATRASLDRLVRDHPVVLHTVCGHGALLNTAALNRFHFGDSPADLPGGFVERRSGGRSSNGRLLDAQVFLLNRRRMSSLDHQKQVSELRELVAQKLQLGWTSIQTMAWLPLKTMAAVAVEAGQPLRIRIIRFPINIEDTEEIQGGAGVSAHPTPTVTLSGLKWFLDGSPCEDARLLDPSASKPRRLYSPEQVRFMLRQGEEQHEPLLFHISGEPALEELLTAMESMPEVDWPSRRVRVEHGEFLVQEVFARAKRLGIVLVQNPAHLTLPPGVPPIVLKNMFPRGPAQALRSVEDAGIPVALGTDGLDNPGLNVLFASTEPNNPAEALTREEAVIAFTRGAAYAEFAEKDKGTIAPGMLADFVVLSKDIFTAPPEAMPSIRAVLTVIGGQLVYDGSSSTDAGVP